MSEHDHAGEDPLLETEFSGMLGARIGIVVIMLISASFVFVPFSKCCRNGKNNTTDLKSW